MFDFLCGVLSPLCSIGHHLAVVIGWIILILTIVKIVLGQEGFDNLRHKFFAKVMVDVLQDNLNKALSKVKQELFLSLKTQKSADPELRSKNAISILEIGVGGGANLEYYPAGAKLFCIDPNASFESYFKRSCSRQASHLDPDIKFVVARGEDMRDVKDNSVDAVVITLVLCSVGHIEGILREIHRVLTPGGKFYFLEHVGDRRGTWRRSVQNVVTDLGIWPFLLDGCCMNRDMDAAIEGIGFSHVDMQKVAVIDDAGRTRPADQEGPAGFFLNPILYGVATK